MTLWSLHPRPKMQNADTISANIIKIQIRNCFSKLITY